MHCNPSRKELPVLHICVIGFGVPVASESWICPLSDPHASQTVRRDVVVLKQPLCGRERPIATRRNGRMGHTHDRLTVASDKETKYARGTPRTSSTLILTMALFSMQIPALAASVITQSFIVGCVRLPKRGHRRRGSKVNEQLRMCILKTNRHSSLHKCIREYT